MILKKRDENKKVHYVTILNSDELPFMYDKTGAYIISVEAFTLEGCSYSANKGVKYILRNFLLWQVGIDYFRQLLFGTFDHFGMTTANTGD